jgi:hypothetical protein
MNVRFTLRSDVLSQDQARCYRDWGHLLSRKDSGFGRASRRFRAPEMTGDAPIEPETTHEQ